MMYVAQEWPLFPKCRTIIIGVRDWLGTPFNMLHVLLCYESVMDSEKRNATMSMTSHTFIFIIASSDECMVMKSIYFDRRRE